MTAAKIISLIGVLAMGIALAYGFIIGDFFKEGAILVSMPWGIVSLVDVYIGFVIFSMWVVFRERNIVRSILWITAIMILGNLVTSLYVLTALTKSAGSWQKFFLGDKYD